MNNKAYVTVWISSYEMLLRFSIASVLLTVTSKTIFNTVQTTLFMIV